MKCQCQGYVHRFLCEQLVTFDEADNENIMLNDSK